MIRTPKVPFIKSRASAPVLFFTTLAIAVGTIVPYTVGSIFKMHPLPAIYFACLVGTIAAYMILVTIVKKIYVRRYGDLL